MLDVWSLIQVCAKTLTGRRALVRHAAVTGIRPRCLPGWSWSEGFDDSLQQTDGTVELEWRIGRKVSTSWLIWFLGPLTCCWVGQIRKAFVAQIDFQNGQLHSSNLHVTLNSRQLQLDTTRSTSWTVFGSWTREPSGFQRSGRTAANLVVSDFRVALCTKREAEWHGRTTCTRTG